MLAGGLYERTSTAAGQPLGSYQRRAPERPVLHELVARHPQSLLAELRDADPDYATRVATMRSAIKRDGLMLALYTGLRHDDVRTMRFDQVDFDDETVHLPNPKGGPGAAFTIPLSKTPLAILRRCKDDNAKDLGRDDEGWCFPGITLKGTVGPIAELRQAGKDDQRFPVEDVHSLRRTWESIANDEIDEVAARIVRPIGGRRELTQNLACDVGWRGERERALHRVVIRERQPRGPGVGRGIGR